MDQNISNSPRPWSTTNCFHSRMGRHDLRSKTSTNIELVWKIPYISRWSSSFPHFWNSSTNCTTTSSLLQLEYKIILFRQLNTISSFCHYLSWQLPLHSQNHQPQQERIHVWRPKKNGFPSFESKLCDIKNCEYLTEHDGRSAHLYIYSQST